MVKLEFFKNNLKIDEHIVNMNIDTDLAIIIHIAFSNYRGFHPRRISLVEFNNLLFKDKLLVITDNSSLKRKIQYWVLEK